MSLGVVGLLSSYLWMGVQVVLFGMVIPYILYFRVYYYFRTRRFYEQQGVKVIGGTYPFIGSSIKILEHMQSSKVSGDNEFCLKKMADECLGETAGTFVYYACADPCLHVADPKVVQEMYTTHNKLFDKHPLVQQVCMRLTGKSILFAETNPEWKKRRLAMTPAFYKGKLIQMVNIAKTSVQKTVERWRNTIDGKPRTRFDFMEEMQLMSARILLTCALGEDVSEEKVNYHHGGKVEQREVSFVLRQTFHDCIYRMASPHVVAFSFLTDCYLMPYEREIKANCESVRNLISSIIDRRREAIRRDPSLKDRGDFLTILLTDEATKDDETLILDECLTFFFAGSQTSGIASTNLIFMLVKHKNIRDKVLKELDDEIVKPYLAAQGLPSDTARDSLQILDLLDFDNLSDLTYYSYCFNESLRMQPPVYFSSGVSMMKQVKCNWLSILPKTLISIDMYRLGNNPKEWIEPQQFIPERFDSKSPYYLTPSGQIRNPYSFSPFLGGQRICLGKTFIENVSKLTVPTLLYNFDFEHLDDVDTTQLEMPHNNMLTTFMLKIDLLLSDKMKK